MARFDPATTAGLCHFSIALKIGSLSGGDLLKHHRALWVARLSESATTRIDDLQPRAVHSRNGTLLGRWLGLLSK
jgi:hypothetical protein